MECVSFKHHKLASGSTLLLPNIHNYRIRVTQEAFPDLNSQYDRHTKLPTILYKESSRGSVILPRATQTRGQSREGRSSIQYRQTGKQIKTVSPIDIMRPATRRMS
jgi:hypothetical protein